jgi:DNA invertase Pin-like site-specific DNA recombinase
MERAEIERLERQEQMQKDFQQAFNEGVKWGTAGCLTSYGILKLVGNKCIKRQ